MNTYTKLAISIVVVVLAVAGLVYSAKGEGAYYRHVDEIMNSPDQWVGKNMKVSGWVVAGSVKTKIENQQTTRTFIIHDKGKQLKVRHTGPVPDTFRDDPNTTVVADGVLQKENGEFVMASHALMAKCPSKYEGAPQNKEISPSGNKPLF